MNQVTRAGARRAAELGDPFAHQVERCLQDTWGHLAPEVGPVYEGFIVFTYTVHSEITIIDWEFGDLRGSPWFAEDLMSFVSSRIKDDAKHGGIWRFDGTFRRFKNGSSRFSGTTRPMRLVHRFASPTSRTGRRRTPPSQRPGRTAGSARKATA